MSRSSHCVEGAVDSLATETPADTAGASGEGRSSADAAAGEGGQRRADLDRGLDRDRCGDPLPLPRPLGPAVQRVANAVFASGAEQSTPRPSPVIPGYEILRELGRGGMGVVYEARQIALGRTVALKMVLLGAHAGPTQLARFRNEALATARLQHPNIVQIHAVEQQDGMPLLALELIDGPCLADRLRQIGLPIRTSAEIAEQLARTLHYAHSQGIVHRDLKPANVMLAPCAEGAAGAIGLCEGDEIRHFIPKITDFGLAKSLTSGSEAPLHATASGELLGTPHYMSPEQTTGHRHEVLPAADVYCLGAILYEMLTGRPPFRGVSLPDMLDQVRRHDPVSPRLLRRDVPRDLETICLKCLEKSPANRYVDAGQLADDLRRFLGGRPILARPPHTWDRFRKWAAREKAKAIALLVIVVAVLLLSGGGWWSSVRLASLANDLKYEVARADAAASTARQQRDQAHQREQEATRLREETEQQRQIADRNYQQARRLVDQFINRLADDPRLRQHGLDDVRKELLAASATAYQSFIRQRSQDSDVVLAWARANQRLAGITSQIALKKDALKLAQEAVTTFEQLASARPQDVELQLELASSYVVLGGISIDLQPDRVFTAACLEKALAIQEAQAKVAPDNARIAEVLLSTLIALGGTYRDQNRPEQSLAILQRAASLARQLADQDPANDARARRLAEAHLNLGFFHATERNWQQSEAAYRESLAIYEMLAGKRPTDVRVHSELAENRSWLANLLSKLNRRAEALVLLHEARKFQEPRLRRHSVVVSDMTKLATTYRYLGHVHRDDGKHEQAIEWYGKAIALHESVLKKEPQRDRNAAFLVGLLLDRAECCSELGQASAADADWQHALHCRRTRVWSEAVQRAEHAARRGDATQVESLVAKLLEAGFDSGSELSRLAQVCCLAANALVQNECRPTAECDEQGQHCISLAFKLLHDARERKWLDDPVNQQRLRTHADFHILHPRNEFVELLSSLPNP